MGRTARAVWFALGAAKQQRAPWGRAHQPRPRAGIRARNNCMPVRSHCKTHAQGVQKCETKQQAGMGALQVPEGAPCGRHVREDKAVEGVPVAAVPERAFIEGAV